MGELLSISKEIIGLSESEAVVIIKSVDGSYQVEKRDGECCHFMDDFRHDRITLTVTDGKIEKAFIC